MLPFGNPLEGQYRTVSTYQTTSKRMLILIYIVTAGGTLTRKMFVAHCPRRKGLPRAGGESCPRPAVGKKQATLAYQMQRWTMDTHLPRILCQRTTLSKPEWLNFMHMRTCRHTGTWDMDIGHSPSRQRWHVLFGGCGDNFKAACWFGTIFAPLHKCS